jgi:hypothetical protein
MSARTLLLAITLAVTSISSTGQETNDNLYHEQRIRLLEDQIVLLVKLIGEHSKIEDALQRQITVLLTIHGVEPTR